MLERTCPLCNETLPRTAEFWSKHKSTADGLRAICKACSCAKAKAWRAANADRKKANDKAWRAANADRHKANAKAWRAANADRHKANAKAWAAANADRKKAYDKAYREAYPYKSRAHDSRRRAHKLQACPAWADQQAIAAVFTEARDMEEQAGEAYHVDHIHPLQSNYICGLHIAANLRAIPARLNLAKSNKFQPYSEDSNGYITRLPKMIYSKAAKAAADAYELLGHGGTK